MTPYEIARYSECLPSDADREHFAVFALRAPADAVRGFIRYQLQMRHRGFAPRARPPRYEFAGPSVLVKKSEAA